MFHDFFKQNSVQLHITLVEVLISLWANIIVYETANPITYEFIKFKKLYKTIMKKKFLIHR
jgi:hypothetical protein